MNAEFGSIDDILAGNEEYEEAKSAREQAEKIFYAAMQKSIESRMEEKMADIAEQMANAMLASVNNRRQKRSAHETYEEVKNRHERAREYTREYNRKKNTWRAKPFDQGINMDDYSMLRNSQEVRDTFILRENGCLPEARKVLSDIVKEISVENGYKVVTYRQAWYHKDMIHYVCEGYKAGSLNSVYMRMLKAHFE